MHLHIKLDGDRKDIEIDVDGDKDYKLWDELKNSGVLNFAMAAAMKKFAGKLDVEQSTQIAESQL